MNITLPEISLVVLIGISGSGKSTFAKTHFKPTEVLSSDYFRGLISDDETDQTITKEAFETLHYVAAKRLANYKLTVIDATSVQESARKPLVALAKQHHVFPIAIVLDMERGYFDKLLLTPASRWSLIIGRVWADAVRAIFFASIMLIAALVAGSGMATGVPGAILILVIAGLFGGAYSGIGIFIAMRTGNAQAAQAGFLLFFPLLFMAPAFAPLAVFDDWLRWIATVNPVTYIMEGMRGLVMEGYAWPVTEGGQIVFGPDGLPLTKDPPALHWAFVSLAGFSVFTLTIAALALRARTRAD